MYRISPFTPVFFSPSGDRHGVKSKCMQVFADTDRILFEVIAIWEESAPPNLIVRDTMNGHEAEYAWKAWMMNGSTTLYFIELQGMSDGIYTAVLGQSTSEPFAITAEDSVLQDTVLLQYSNSDNRQRNDVVFWIDGMQRFFDFRIPGGFKDDNWTFAVNNEQFSVFTCTLKRTTRNSPISKIPPCRTVVKFFGEFCVENTRTSRSYFLAWLGTQRHRSAGTTERLCHDRAHSRESGILTRIAYWHGEPG